MIVTISSWYTTYFMTTDSHYIPSVLDNFFAPFSLTHSLSSSLSLFHVFFSLLSDTSITRFKYKCRQNTSTQWSRFYCFHRGYTEADECREVTATKDPTAFFAVVVFGVVRCDIVFFCIFIVVSSVLLSANRKWIRWTRIELMCYNIYLT